MRKFLIIIFLLATITQLKTNLDGPDADHYFAVAKSLSFDQDLMLHNQFKELEYPITVTNNYHILEWHQIGVSLMWTFVFNFFKVLHLPLENKYLIILVNIVDYFVGVLSVILIYKILCFYFKRSVSVLGLLVVLFGTNLFAYLFFLNGSAHSLTVFLVAVFLWYYLKTKDKRSGLDWVILGGITGLMVMTRGESVLYVFLPAYDLLRNFKRRELNRFFLFVGLYILGFVFTFSPQLSFWKIIFSGLYRPYAEADFFTGNKFLEVLFSCSRGFVFFSPLIMICYFAGLKRFYLKNKAIVLGSVFIFLSLLYGLGRAKYGWWQGSSFGSRHFLVFLPILAFPLCECFGQLSIKKQTLITIISSIWSFFLFSLFVSDKELDSYKGVLQVIDPGFIREITHSIYFQVRGWIIAHFWEKVIFLGSVFFLSSLLFLAWKKTRSFFNLRKTSIVIVIVAIVYTQALFISCYYKDRIIINELKKQGFYKMVVFGVFDKVDVAEAYLEYTVEAIRDGKVDQAISMIRRAIRLYPPSQERYFQCLYEVHGDFPVEFRSEFIKNPDSLDYLGLSMVFYKNNDLIDSAYYYQEAQRLEPGIVNSLSVDNSGFLAFCLDEAKSLLREIAKL